MSKSICSCIEDGDPICTGAPNAKVHLDAAYYHLRSLCDLLVIIQDREGEQETALGQMTARIEAARDLVLIHIN